MRKIAITALEHVGLITAVTFTKKMKQENKKTKKKTPKNKKKTKRKTNPMIPIVKIEQL